MIDFSKYSVNEQQAINDVLYDLHHYLLDTDMEWGYLRNALFLSSVDLERELEQQARDYAAAEAEKVDRIKQACIAGAPPAEEPAPDMFGWVNDALDGLQV